MLNFKRALFRLLNILTFLEQQLLSTLLSALALSEAVVQGQGLRAVNMEIILPEKIHEYPHKVFQLTPFFFSRWILTSKSAIYLSHVVCSVSFFHQNSNTWAREMGNITSYASLTVSSIPGAYISRTRMKKQETQTGELPGSSQASYPGVQSAAAEREGALLHQAGQRDPTPTHTDPRAPTLTHAVTNAACTPSLPPAQTPAGNQACKDVWSIV